MKCRLIRDMPCAATPDFPEGMKPKGTTIEHPETFILVRMGVAVPEDEECAKAANVSQEQFQAARKAYEKVSRGIVPEDYEAFDKGYMIGYNPDGSWKPGPNYRDYEWERLKEESPLIFDD